MDILKNETIKNAAAVLWHKFLLAETVNDIILSEIKDRQIGRASRRERV